MQVRGAYSARLGQRPGAFHRCSRDVPQASWVRLLSVAGALQAPYWRAPMWIFACDQCLAWGPRAVRPQVGAARWEPQGLHRTKQG